MSKTIYAVITHLVKPVDKKSANQAGWNQNRDNYRYDEQFVVQNRIRNRDISTASIILDLVNRRVVKSTYGQRDYNHLFNYVIKNYDKYLEQSCTHYGFDYQTIKQNGTIPSQT